MIAERPTLPIDVRPGSLGTDLDRVLDIAYRVDASDVSIQSGDYIVFMISGRQVRASTRVVQHFEVQGAVNQIYGPNGVSMITQGNPIDKRYEIRPGRGERVGFRVHILPARIDGNDDGISITMRVLPKNPPDIDERPVPRGIVMNSLPPNGLITISGVTSSGKSTLISSILRYAYEIKADSSVTACGRKIGTYEAPIEYIYDGIDSLAPKISQTEVGGTTGIASWGLAIKTAMRRALSIIMIGECRDPETMDGCIESALTGHTTLTTLHAGSVGDSFRRMTSMAAESSGGQDAVTAKLLGSVRLMVVQALVPKVDGGRVALREWLPVNRTLRDRLFDVPSAQVANEMQKECHRLGMTMGHSALHAHRAGLISMEVAAAYSGMTRGELMDLVIDDSVFESFRKESARAA